MTALAKQHWLERCAARFKDRAALDDKQAAEYAEVCLESLEFDLTENPEDAADEELSYWTDDGED